MNIPSLISPRDVIFCCMNKIDPFSLPKEPKKIDAKFKRIDTNLLNL